MNMDFIGDEEIRSLQQQDGEFKCGNPAWHLFLVFLSYENCLALVNICDGENHYFGVILHPFTMHTNILHVLETNVLVTPHINPRDNDLEADCYVQAYTKTCENEAQKNIILCGDRIEE
jgi:hypothetical protein